MVKKTIFFESHSELSDIISIKSPKAFKESIKELKEGGITTKEKKALVLAQNRARAILHKKNLSEKERKQFKAISKVKLPKITSNGERR